MGRTLMFPVTTCASLKALQERFEPGSRGDLYLAEFQTRCKTKTKTVKI